VRALLSRFDYTKWSDPEKKAIVRGTLHSFVIQGVSILLVFAGNLVLTRRAGADAYGKYVHIFNWVSILAVLVTGGREDLVLTEITRYDVARQPAFTAWLIKRTNSHILLAWLFTGIGFLTTIFILPVVTLHEYRYDFLIAWTAVYFVAFLTLNQAILQALNHIRLSQVVDRLVRPFLLILFFGVALFAGYSASSRLLIGVAEMALGGSCLVLAALLLAKTRTYFGARQNVFPPEKLTKKTVHFFLITLMTLLITKISMLVLPYFSDRRSIGIFNISYRFADLVVYPFFLMHAVLPQLFARHALTDVSDKQSLYSSSTKLMMALSLPLMLLIAVVGKYLLGWFGNDFTSGYSALILLSISQLFYSLFGPANTVLMMQGRERQSVVCLLVYVLLLFGLNLVLVPRWGITGGAFSTLIGCLVYNILLAVQVYRFSGVVSPFFAFLVRREK
jgi:O-antigen/teichoic acid export membrane protein